VQEREEGVMSGTVGQSESCGLTRGVSARAWESVRRERDGGSWAWLKFLESYQRLKTGPGSNGYDISLPGT
jgi:hypothetical protein